MNVNIDFSDIFQCNSNGMVVTDCEGVITHINIQAEKILSIVANNYVGRYVKDILPASDNLLQHCFNTGDSILGQQVFGGNTSLVLNVSPVSRMAEIFGAVFSFQELSIFEKSAKSLESFKWLNHQLDAVFNASYDGIWVCDGKGVVIRINKASENLNGIKEEDVLGKNVNDLLQSNIFDQAVTSQVLKSGCRQTIMQYIGKTNKHLLVTGTPATDDNGNISLVVLNERDITELNALQKQIEQNRKITEKYREELADRSLLELNQNEFIAESRKMRHVLEVSLKLSRVGASSILILGESGTGKSLLAKLIHKNSMRHKNPFVEINCTAIPENLLEAELFGYEKGAFTGAREKGKVGLIELARDGTLFLDEIGDMPPALQAKLLKYLDDKEIRRIGGTSPIKVECSIVAATNQDLGENLENKSFRNDLYYRLNSFTLEIPPLRERPEDVSALVRFYLNKYNRKYASQRKIDSSTLRFLQNYAFPGNIRELIHIVENAVVMSDDNRIDEFIQTSIRSDAADLFPKGKINSNGKLRLADKLNEVERQLLVHVKNQCRNTREMASMLDISQPTVVRKLKKHAL